VRESSQMTLPEPVIGSEVYGRTGKAGRKKTSSLA
jgi:hypothetical protein